MAKSKKIKVAVRLTDEQKKSIPTEFAALVKAGKLKGEARQIIADKYDQSKANIKNYTTEKTEPKSAPVAPSAPSVVSSNLSAESIEALVQRRERLTGELAKVQALIGKKFKALEKAVKAK